MNVYYQHKHTHRCTHIDAHPIKSSYWFQMHYHVIE